MSSERARTVNSMANTISADHQAHGLYALSPLILGIMTLASLVAFIIGSAFQIAGTEQAVMGLLRTGIQVDPALVGQQVQDFINGRLSVYSSVAFVIGYGSQFVLLLVSFPPDVAMYILHRRYNPNPNSGLADTAVRLQKLQKIMMRFIIGMNVCCDFLYVAQGHDIFAMWWGFLPLPNFAGANGGVYIVGFLYPLVLCFITIFTARYFFTFLEVLILKLRGLA